MAGMGGLVLLNMAVPKHEIRNAKSETNKKSEIQICATQSSFEF